jgi:saccharopine dehydrogenase (NAD+, L-lysine-forming)
MMKIGLIKEGKFPRDSRIVLTPTQVQLASKQFPAIEIVVQSSEHRCFSDEEYLQHQVQIVDNIDDCEILIGVKEVALNDLIENKTYFFFSHTIKAQLHNRKLLQTILAKNIRIIDYECLVDDAGLRVIAFGRWAGIVGAHNGLYTWGKRTQLFDLKRAKDCKDFEELKSLYTNIQFPAIKIVISGNGRVGNGAAELLLAAGIRQVSSEELLQQHFNEAVFTQLDCEELFTRKSDGGYETNEFYAHPERYQSAFRKFTEVTDLFINAIFWDPKAPAFFSDEDMASEKFNIKVIADITCDIAPESSVPSTIRASTIAEPVYGYDVKTKAEIAPFQTQSIDIMAIDNLPNELPRDASTSFGEQFIEHVLPELLKKESAFLNQATIARDGDLTPKFEYLRSYVNETPKK